MGVGSTGRRPSLLTPSAWAPQDIVTESNQFDLVGFIPLLRERIYSNNQYARQFIISWVGTRGAASACQSQLRNAADPSASRVWANRRDPWRWVNSGT